MFSDIIEKINFLQGPALDKDLLKNFSYIVGIDEVGRGCLAGPVISCACILSEKGIFLPGLNDSKQLTTKRREILFPQILENTLDISIGLSTVQEIDEINIFQATKLSMYRALETLVLPLKNSILLVDGLLLPYKKIHSYKLIKGDTKSPSIMAASIVAKVVRDKLMDLYAQEFPHFLFEKHKGYGTVKHKELLSFSTFTAIHRKTFMPLKKIISENTEL